MLQFTISFPTDEGFFGRQCNSPECSRYFKVFKDCIKDEMYCPYCAISFPNNQLWTDDQNQYIREAATEQGLEWVHSQISGMLRNLAAGTSGNKHVRITYEPSDYIPRQISPRYMEREVDSELKCPTCFFRFQVHGIFGYCPGCRSENLLIYDANIAIIKQEVSTAQDPLRELRHAYSDLVSTFEIFCKRTAKLLTNEPNRFQALFDTRKFFKQHLSVDILLGLSNEELLTVRRVFQKRHAYEHYEGIIEEHYVREIPEDKHLFGKKAELSLDEFLAASSYIRRVLDTLVLATNKYRS